MDPADVLALAIEVVRPAAEAKGVRLEASIEAGAGPILGDPDRLQQVVWNLLTNAVKFTPSGGRVEVRLQRDGEQVEIAVEDTGQGIAAAFLPHVFERFRQADASHSRAHGGLGLGLAISRHLVEMHGGTLRAFSEGIGRGATFRAELPLMPKPEVEESAAAWHPGDGRHTLQDIRVLAVDDESDALTLVRDTLEEAGATVRTARSVEEALNGLNGEVPHVIISDLGLPTVDGLEFIRRVRASADPRLRALPAAALTAYARPEDRAESARAGFQVHLAKPIDPRTLVSAVSRLVGREGLPNDAELA